jgi:hypothetical protein
VSEQVPWERQREAGGGLEPNLWYDRFVRFCEMGPARSLLGLYNEGREKARKGATKTVPQSWRSAAKQWDWHQRAEAYDQHQRDARQTLRDAERKCAEDEAIADADAVIAALRESLDGALEAVANYKSQVAHTAEVGKGKVRVEVTGSLDAGDLDNWLKVRHAAEKLRRLGLGMPERITQSRIADAEGDRVELPAVVYHMPPMEEEGSEDGHGSDDTTEPEDD